MVLREHTIVRATWRAHRVDERISLALPHDRTGIQIGRRAPRMTQQRHMRAKRLRDDGRAGCAPLREECVARGGEALGHTGRPSPDNLAISPIAQMVEGEHERRERRALHEREQYRQTGGIDFVEKGQRQVQRLGTQYTSAAFRVSRSGPLVKLRTYTRPRPQGKEESHENTTGWILLMILIVDGLLVERQLGRGRASGPRRLSDERSLAAEA